VYRTFAHKWSRPFAILQESHWFVQYDPQPCSRLSRATAAMKRFLKYALLFICFAMSIWFGISTSQDFGNPLHSSEMFFEGMLALMFLLGAFICLFAISITLALGGVSCAKGGRAGQMAWSIIDRLKPPIEIGVRSNPASTKRRARASNACRASQRLSDHHPFGVKSHVDRTRSVNGGSECVHTSLVCE
jgi:hypothetical protein